MRHKEFVFVGQYANVRDCYERKPQFTAISPET